MSNILGNVVYKYTLSDESPIDIEVFNEHWQKRDRRQQNRKWRNLSSKLFRREKVSG